MDVIKTRLQLQNELRKRGQSQKSLYRNVFHAMYVVARTEGVFALQKGLTPALIYGFGMNALRLGIYKSAEERGYTKNKNGTVNIGRSLMWSCLSGTIGAGLINPVNVIKTRMQASGHQSIAVGHQHKYENTISAIKTIYKKEGPRGFFAGLIAICYRLAVGSTVQLTTFAIAKEYLIANNYFNDSPIMLSFAASAVSGLCVSFCVCPFDVAAVRLYNQDAGKRLYNGMIDCLTKTFRAEGVYGLYKGLGPLYLRLAPHTTISLVIWDRLNNIYNIK